MVLVGPETPFSWSSSSIQWCGLALAVVGIPMIFLLQSSRQTVGNSTLLEEGEWGGISGRAFDRICRWRVSMAEMTSKMLLLYRSPSRGCSIPMPFSCLHLFRCVRSLNGRMQEANGIGSRYSMLLRVVTQSLSNVLSSPRRCAVDRGGGGCSGPWEWAWLRRNNRGVCQRQTRFRTRNEHKDFHKHRFASIYPLRSSFHRQLRYRHTQVV